MVCLCVRVCAHKCVCVCSLLKCAHLSDGVGEGSSGRRLTFNEKLIRSPLDVVWLAGSDCWRTGSVSELQKMVKCCGIPEELERIGRPRCW